MRTLTKNEVVTRFQPPSSEGRLAASDRRRLAEMTPVELLREFDERKRLVDFLAAKAGLPAADRADTVQLLLRVERELLDRLGSLWKLQTGR
jgi:hypothetical protein